MTAPVSEFTAGVPVDLSPTVRRVVAPNPGMMTGPGTNTYLVGGERLAVIDPGPDDPGHIDAIVAAAGDRPIGWVLVTHTHPDHWPGAARLGARTGAPLYGYGARDGFEPDHTLSDGDRVGEGSGLPLVAVHTPGHASNHLCYLQPDTRLLFSGDHVMSGSTVVISPPDGDMTQYLDALQRVRDEHLAAIAPGHGGLIDDPERILAGLIQHRLGREQKVAAALEAVGAGRVTDLVPAVYDDVSDALHAVAFRSLWAHLRRLRQLGRAACVAPDDPDATWEATGLK